MYKIHFNLDKLTLSLLFFMSFDNKFKINLFFGGFVNPTVFLSLLSISRIVVYVLMEKQYLAKFALVFNGFLLFGNMFATCFISWRISLLFKRILQYLNNFLFNRIFLNSLLTSS